MRNHIFRLALLPLLICLATAAVLLPGNGAGVELACDGGFEVPSIAIGTTPAPISVCEWRGVNRGGGAVTELSTLSHIGTKSARVDTVGATDGAYFYQDLASTSPCFVLRSWVRRSADDNVIRLMADWDRGPSGSNTPISSVFLDDSVFRLDAWSGALVNGTISVSGSQWFEISVVAAGDYAVQGLLVNGALSVVDFGTDPGGGSAVSAPETLLLGDPSTAGSSNGNYRYDDVSLDASGCPRDSDGDGLTDGPELTTHNTNPLDSDTDNDGCADGEEPPSVNPDPTTGGARNPTFFWDFFDVPTPASYTRDKAVSVADISAVVARFGAARPGGAPDKATALAEALSAPPLPPAYHAGYDRTVAGALTGPPDGAITVQDIGRAVAQFGHSCIGPP